MTTVIAAVRIGMPIQVALWEEVWREPPVVVVGRGELRESIIPALGAVHDIPFVAAVDAGPVPSDACTLSGRADDAASGVKARIVARFLPLRRIVPRQSHKGL